MTKSAASTGSRWQGGGRERVDLSLIAFGAACLLFSHRSVFWRTSGKSASGSVLDQTLYDPSMTAPVLALSVFALLLFQRRARVVSAYRAGVGSAFGIAIFGLGVATLLWSRQISADRLLMPSLILHLIGAAMMIGGGRMVRALGMPFAALATSVALPPQVMQELVFALQLWTVSLSSFLLDLLGRPHEVQGDLILYGGDRFQVIEGCSGFKSTLSLVLAAVVYADLVVRSPRMKGVLLALAVPIGIFMNAVRVAILILGRIPADSDEHAAYGILAVVVGVVVLAVAELSLTRIGASARWRRSSPGLSTASEVASGRVHLAAPLRRLAATLAVVSTLVVVGVPRGSWPSPSAAINIETLPESIDGRTARALKVDDAWLGSVWFGHRLYRSYEPDPPRTGSIRVFIGHEDVTSAEQSGYSPKTFIPRSGWRSIERRPSIEAGARIAEPGFWNRWVIEYPDRRILVQQWRTGFAPWGWEIACRWLGLDRAGVLGKRRSPLVIRIEMDAGVGDEARAWMILRQLAARIEAWRTQSGA